MPSPAPPDAGLRALDALIGRGPPGTLLWDIDGTLFDPRPRMLHTLHAYGETEAVLDECRPTYEATAAGLGLDVAAFGAFWDMHYWADGRFLLDAPIPPVLERLRQAVRMDWDNQIVTGRVEAVRDRSLRQLAHQGVTGLPIWDKPNIGVDTLAFKAETTLRLLDEGLQVRAFVTDRADEIAAVAAACAQRDCTAEMFLVRCGPGHGSLDPLLPGTAHLIEAWSEAAPP